MTTRFAAALTAAVVTWTSAIARAEETPAPPGHQRAPRVEIDSWEPGDPIPPGYHPDLRARKELIVAGAVILGVFYHLSVLGALLANVRFCLNFSSVGCGGASAQDVKAAALYVPVAGPFLQMTQTTEATGNVLNVIDGVAQSAGLAALIIGLASPQRVLIRNDSAAIRARPVPFLTGHTAGLGLVASF
jgi:hypothetical protein